jgi:tight adherence protein B
MSGIRLSAQEYILSWCAATLLPVFVGAMLGMNPIAIMGLAVIGFAILPVAVKRSQARRQQLFNKQLGDALTIMSNCMRSGYSFQQAMASIAQEMQPPISTEFERVVKEISYGTTMERALNSMVARVQNKDLELLVSAVLTSAQVGANLSEILDTISETVRDRIRLREEVRVLSAQGRMSGLIIGLMPVFVILLLMVMNPTYFAGFTETPVGKLMIGVSIGMELTGFFVINKIVDIQY